MFKLCPIVGAGIKFKLAKEFESEKKSCKYRLIVVSILFSALTHMIT